MFLLLIAQLSSAKPAEEAPRTPQRAQSSDQIDTPTSGDLGTLTVFGQLQTWITAMDQDEDPQADPATYGDPEADPGFTIARARIGFEGQVPLRQRDSMSYVDWRLSLGVASTYDVLTPSTEEVQLVDAFGRYNLVSGGSTTSIAAGIHRVPLGREALMSSNHLVFQERGVQSAWTDPGRQAGVIVHQTYAFGDDELAPVIGLQLGGFNGASGIFLDTDPGLTLGGRVDFSIGDTYRTYSHGLKNALGVGGAFVRDDALGQDTTSMGADLLARFKWVTLMGEVITTKRTQGDTAVVLPDTLGEVNQLGYMGQVSVYMPIKRSGLEFAGRLASFDDDTAADNGGEVSIIHAGMTWRNALPALDVGAGYIHRDEAAKTKNDTVRVWMGIRPRYKLR